MFRHTCEDIINCLKHWSQTYAVGGSALITVSCSLVLHCWWLMYSESFLFSETRLRELVNLVSGYFCGWDVWQMAISKLWLTFNLSPTACEYYRSWCLFCLVCQVAEVQVGDKLQRDGLLQVLETMTATSTNRKQEGGELASALVDWVLHAQGFQQARAVYNRYIVVCLHYVWHFLGVVSVQT